MATAKSSPAPREVEWQLDALDLRPVERWFDARFGGAAVEGEGGARPAGAPSPPSWPAELLAVPRPGKRLVDAYLDTEDWRIVRAGFVLRTRRRNGVLEATMKDLVPATDGLRDRLEVTEPIRGAGVGDLDPEGPVGRRVRALSGSRPLREVLEVRTRRRLFSLTVHDEPVGEVALDDTTIVLAEDAHRLRLQRVEVEVAASWVGALQPFVEQLRRDCGLQPATLSKFEAGLMAAGVVVPGRTEVAAPALGVDATIGELAFSVLRADTSAMLVHEPGTRLGDDPEDLHQMRVATRRLRAALALFVPALPARAARLSEEIRWLAAVLGAVRDLDVQLDDLEQWCEDLAGEHGQALDHFRDLLVAHREQARVHLLEALESRRYERLVSGLRSMLDQGPARRSPQAGVLAVVALPELIDQRHRAAVRAARRAQRSGVLADFHRLRIRCKRLRYAVEFTSGLYGGSAKRFGKKVAGLQDQLGRIQDAEVAYERLRRIAGTDEGAALSPPTVFAMGMVAQRCLEGAEQRLRALAKPADVLQGGDWRRLAGALDDEKAAAADRLARAAAVAAPAKQVASVRRTPAAGAPVTAPSRPVRTRPVVATSDGAGAAAGDGPPATRERTGPVGVAPAPSQS